MKFEDVLAICHSSCSRWRAFIDMEPTSNYSSCSIRFFKQVGLRYGIRKTKPPFYLVDVCYVSNPDSITPFYKLTNDEQYKLDVNGLFNHESFNQVIVEICADKLATASVERFGCCSSFIECSDALVCLHPNEYDYLGCYYRENLEAGRVFYGVNRNI